MDVWGTWVYGDTGTDLELALKKTSGAAYDVTGATSIALVMVSGQPQVSATVNGTILGAGTDGKFSFPAVGNVADPGDRGTLTFECFAKWIQATKQHYSRPSGKIVIRKFPP